MSRGSSSKRNEFGPDLMGYYRHILLELLSEKEDLVSTIMPSGESSGGDIKGEIQGAQTQDIGKKGQNCRDSFPLFIEAIGGLSEYKKERLKLVLDEVATFLNEEADKILGQILAISKIGSEKLLTSHATGSDEDMVSPLRAKKRKAASFPVPNHSEGHGLPSSDAFKQVQRDIQVIQGSGEIRQEAVEKYSAGLLAKLDKMAQGIDDLLNEVASKCRPMTTSEKHQLGKRIRKLPEKALDRVVEIVEMKRFLARQDSDKVSINLEEQDDVTLWRLYYYVEVVLKANKI